MRWCASVFVSCLLSGTVFAQPEPEPTADGKMIYRLALSPQDYRKPVSRWHLLPEYAEMEPGSKVQGFLKCFMEQQVFFGYEQEKRREDFAAKKLEELPIDVREQCGIYGGLAYNPKTTTLMVMMDRAARYTHTEWNEWHDIRRDGIYFLLPDVQKLRSISSVLRLRLRGEVRNKEFERAIITIRSMLGLAKALEQHPTLIGNLVGIAIATQALNGLEEMIAQPDCPNLFWAMGDLPPSLIDIRYGLSGERLFLTHQLEKLMKTMRPMTSAELEETMKFIDELVGLIKDSHTSTVEKILQKPQVRYAMYAADAKRVESSIQRIVKSGYPESAVKALPPLQIILHDDLLNYEILRDELFKWSNVPLYQAREGLASTEKMIAQSRKDFILGPLGVATTGKVQAAKARLDQRVAYLRTIEAIRLHAYQNNGQLPQNLSEIKLPMPLDPVTGQHFIYSVQGDVATLTGGNPSMDNNPRTNRVYEITLRK